MEVLPFPAASKSSSTRSLSGLSSSSSTESAHGLAGFTGLPNIHATLRTSADVQITSKPRRNSRAPPVAAGLTPLSPICASPICTPTTSAVIDPICPPDILPETRSSSRAGSVQSAQEYLTPPATPAKDPQNSVAFHLPTWLAVPPTPPALPSLEGSQTADAESRPQRLVSLPASSSIPLYTASKLDSADFKRASSMLYRRVSSPCASTSLNSLSPAMKDATSPRLMHKKQGSGSRGTRPPIFHVPNDASDNDDGSDNHADGTESIQHSPTSRPLELSSAEDHDSADSLDRDDLRRYHALVELLATEVGYLIDLRALVNVYLRNLATLDRKPTGSSSAFSRSSSFVYSSRPSSSTQLHSVIDGSSEAIHPLTAPQGKEKERGHSRRIFTNAQVQLLSRNADEIVRFHERFVEQLETIVTQMGFPMPAHDSEPQSPRKEQLAKVNNVIRAVSGKFATESSRFYTYQNFCAGHPEAMNLVKKAQQQFSSDWNSFEQRSSIHIASQGLEEKYPAVPPTSPTSASTIDHSPSPPPSAFPTRTRTRSLSAVEGGRVRDLAAKARTHRLAFIDYMIKPIQRICRYPLLLQQLKSKGTIIASEKADADVVVESATQAMRHVATSVDDARHRQDLAVQSSLISSRILACATSSHTSTSRRFFTTDTQAFFTSLGTCLFAGSLDVIHYQLPMSPKAVKYLGAFLYVGGYLILAKVKGKTYEPRHWFSLNDFQLVDVQSAEEILPCSFRLTYQGHDFEFAAACQSEKEAWISAIKESLTFDSVWVNPPPSSIQTLAEGELIPSMLEDGPFEIIETLPTIQSIQGLNSHYEEVEADKTTRQQPHKTVSRCESAYRSGYGVSRRTSTASIRNIFATGSSNEPTTILIQRSSVTARLYVDQSLQDVISEPCLAARATASRQEQELFSAPRSSKSSLPRSNSALGITGAVGSAAKRRLSRHESVRVPRRNNTFDSISSDHGHGSAGRYSVRRHSLARRRFTFASEAESTGSDAFSESPRGFSQCSSTTPSVPTSSSASPVLSPVHATRTQDISFGSLSRPTTASNSSASSSLPSRLPMANNSQVISMKTQEKTRASGFFKRWSKGHRKSRSASDTKEIVSLPSFPTSSSAKSPTLPEFDFANNSTAPTYLVDTHPHSDIVPSPSTNYRSGIHNNSSLGRLNPHSSFRSKNIPFLHRFL
jgi:uncharacterized membrane protein YgdD (TMEM256/DUF423 family)